MPVLGIDPGSLASGWALLEGTAARPRLVEAGVIRLSPRLAFPQRLARLYDELTRLAAAHAPSSAAVESPFHGASARSALQLAHARGVILAALAGAGVPLTEYSPATVKKSVCGNGRADKVQVAHMVCRLLRVERPAAREHDLSDALAVALCHLSDQAYHAALARGGDDQPRLPSRRVRRPPRL